MGLFGNKDKNKPLQILMVHKSGLPLNEDSNIYVILDKENRNVIFKYPIGENEISLSIDKITNIGTTSEEIIKEKSGVGRAVAGGLLFGPTGAIVGAVTQKDKKKKQVYDVINYTSNGETKSIILFCKGDINHFTLFSQLKELIPPKDNSNIEL